MTIVPTDTYLPSSQADLARFLQENARGTGRPVYPFGGGTALDYGYPIAESGTALSLAHLANTIEYPARDMTITVEAGVTFDRLGTILQTERQRLPIDVPQPDRATLGGIVATDARGPRSFGLGSLRDYVIGVSAVDASGQPFKAGGRVVKNVAGYDLCKLMIGSLGTLGVITQLTLKLRPIPESTGGVWATFSKLAEIETVLARLMSSAARPIAMEVLEPLAAAEIAAACQMDLPTGFPVLFLAVEGGEHETTWQLDTLGSEISALGPRQSIRLGSAATEKLIRSQTEYPARVDSPVTFQAHMLPSKTLEFIERAARHGVALAAHAGTGVVIGRLPGSVHSAEMAAQILNPLRQFASQGRGNLVVLNCDPIWKQNIPVFGDPQPSWPLMRQLKAQLDPADILNRGRMWNSAQLQTTR